MKRFTSGVCGALAGASLAWLAGVPARAAEPAGTQPAAAEQGDLIPENQSLLWTDAAGKPIVGATITITRAYRAGMVMTTDSRGRSWSYNGNSGDGQEIVIKHPSFELVSRRGLPYASNRTVMLPVLLEGSSGMRVTGSVTDADGKPSAGARVRFSTAQWEGGSQSINEMFWTVADAKGNFALAPVKMGEFRLPKETVFTVLAMGAGSQAVIPEKGTATVEKPVAIKLTQETRRDITLTDADGKPVELLGEDAVVGYRAQGDRGDTYSGRVTTLKGLALPAGQYTIWLRDCEYGPGVVAPGQLPGALMLKAPEKIDMRVTVEDLLTGKPVPDVMVVATTQSLFDRWFLGYLSPEMWTGVMKAVDTGETGSLPRELKVWFAQVVGKQGTHGTTDSQGQVRLTLARQARSQSLDAMVLGPGEFPWSQLTPADKESSRLWRLRAATVLVRPEGESMGTISGQITIDSKSLDPGVSGRMMGRESMQMWYVSNVELHGQNRLLLPAGLPVRLTLENGNGLSYQSDVLKLEPGQVLDLGEVKLRLKIPYYVAVQDKGGRTLNGVTVYLKGAGNQWKALGTTDGEGLRMTGEGEAELVVGAMGYGQREGDEPAYRETVKLKAGRNIRANIKTDMSYEDFRVREAASKLAVVKFRDALGKPMPAGTVVKGPGGAGAGEVLDEKGEMTGKMFGALYVPGMTVSHPDYGTAVIQGGPWFKPNEPMTLPLASKSVADEDFVFKGRVEGADGKPAGGVRVMASVPWLPIDTQYYTLRETTVVAQTEPDGTYRIHAITAGAEADKLAKARSSEQPARLVAFSPDPWVLGWQGRGEANKEQVIKIGRAAKEFTVKPTYRDGRTMGLWGIRGVFKASPEAEEQTLNQGWIPESGKRPLAYGIYQFRGEGGPFAPLVVDEKSPETLVLTYPKALKLTGLVTEAGTGVPVQGAVVVVCQGGEVSSLGILPDKAWEQMGKLPEKPNVKRDLPEQVVNATSPTGAGLTDAMGEFAIGDPGASGNQLVTVLAKGYVPWRGWVDLSKATGPDVAAMRPVELAPGAFVTVEPQTLRVDVEGANGYDRRAQVTYQLPSAWMRLTDGGKTQPLAETMNLTSWVKTGPCTLCVPAGQPIKFWIDRNMGVGSVVAGQDVGMWEVAGTFKAGETTVAKPARVKQLHYKLRFEKPDGTALAGRLVCRVLGENPTVLHPANGSTDKEGVVTLVLPAGQKCVLSLGDMRADAKENRFECLAPATAGEAIVIKVTAEQMGRLGGRE